jgi:hypothetical protein
MFIACACLFVVAPEGQNVALMTALNSIIENRRYKHLAPSEPRRFPFGVC